MLRSPRACILWFLLAAAVVYGVGNDSVPIWDRDEPRYANASRHLLRSGDWVVPRMGWGDDPNTPRTAKPIFIYWVQALSMKVFGQTTFAARFPSVVGMVATLTVLAGVLFRAVGPRRAFWAVFILGTSALAIVTAKMAITDAVLLLFVTVAQVCLFSLYFRGPSLLRTIILWLAVALAGLTKGPVVLGVLFTTMLVLAAFDYARERSIRAALGWWGRTRPLLGIVILAVIVGPWLYLLHQREPAFLPRIFSHDLVARASRGLEGHSGPPGYYLLTIWGTFFPWSLILPMTLAIAWKTRRLPTVRFALAAVIGPWVMMEFVQTKLVHYLLPVFPPLAYLAAEAIIRCLRSRNRCRWLTPPLTLIGAAIWCPIVIVLAIAPWFIGRFYSPLPTIPTAVVSAIGITWALTILALFLRRRPLQALASLGTGMIVLMAVVFGLYLPAARFLQISPDIAAVLAQHNATAPGAVKMMGYREQSIAWYQGGAAAEADDAYLQSTPPAGWPAYLVITRDLWTRQPAPIQSQWQEIHSTKGINYAGGGKWLEVLLLRRVNPSE